MNIASLDNCGSIGTGRGSLSPRVRTYRALYGDYELGVGTSVLRSRSWVTQGDCCGLLAPMTVVRAGTLDYCTNHVRSDVETLIRLCQRITTHVSSRPRPGTSWQVWV